MRRVLWILAFSCLIAACGFGLADDSGAASPAGNPWGWQCADGSTPPPDAGCPPGDGGP